jgi:hypothetical protein
LELTQHLTLTSQMAVVVAVDFIPVKAAAMAVLVAVALV